LRIFLSIAILFLLVAQAPCLANGALNWKLATPIIELAEIKELIEQEKSTKPEQIIELYSKTAIKIFKNQAAQQTTVAYYYPTTESIQEAGSDSIYWDNQGETINVTSALVISANGTEHSFDPKSVRIVDTDAYDVFTDTKEIILQWPTLAAGSVTVLTYERLLESGKSFLFTPSLKARYPKRKLEITLNWDKERPSISIDEGVLDCVESTNMLNCTASMVDAIELDNNVYYRDIMPQMQVSSHRSWDQVIQEMAEKVQQAIQNKDSLNDVLSRLQNQDSPISAAIDLASREIRYVSFSEGEHSNQPHLVEDTLRNRYGDCKDKSTLLTSLLQSMGHDAYPVLVSTNRTDSTKLKVPSLYFFDHMVVCVLQEGKEHCIDPTNSKSGSFITDSGIQGKVRLNIVPGASPDTVPTDKHTWLVKIVNNLTFNNDGTQSEELQRTYKNQYGSWYRQRLTNLSKQEIQDQLLETYRGTVSESQNVEFNIENLDQYHSDLIITSTTSFGPFWESSENLDYSDFSFWLRPLINDSKLSNRIYDEALLGLLAHSEYVYNFSSLWTPTELGPTVNLKSKYGEFSRTYKIENNNNKVTVLSQLSIPSQTVPVAEIEDYNKFLEFIYDETKIRFWGNAISVANQPAR